MPALRRTLSRLPRLGVRQSKRRPGSAPQDGEPAGIRLRQARPGEFARDHHSYTQLGQTQRPPRSALAGAAVANPYKLDVPTPS
jgi:hypothetical protein